MIADSEAEALLRAFGDRPEAAIDIGEAALLLGSFDRPRVGLQRYRDHLDALARDTEAALPRDGAGLDARIAAITVAIVDRHGYGGDAATYDDLQNANLLRVIDRRKGLPVALGILYLATARRLGWEMAGLNFPGHFLIRLDAEGERAILDPFNRGRVRGVAELRDMLKAAAGAEAELSPAHYAPVGDREVLLRLQNNIKLRLVQMNEIGRALRVLDRMLLLAPHLPELLREAGLLNLHLGNLNTAMQRLEASLAAETSDAARHRTAALLQDLRRRLH